MHLNASLTAQLTVSSGGRMQPGHYQSHPAGSPEGSGWPLSNLLAPLDHLLPELQIQKEKQSYIESGASAWQNVLIKIVSLIASVFSKIPTKHRSF